MSIISIVHPVLARVAALFGHFDDARDELARVHGAVRFLEALEHAPHGVRRHARAGRDAGGPLVPSQKLGDVDAAVGPRGRGAADPHGLHAPCERGLGAGRRPRRRGGRGAAAGEESDMGMPVWAGGGGGGGSPRPARNSDIGMPVWVGCVAFATFSAPDLSPSSRFWVTRICSKAVSMSDRMRSSLCSMTELAGCSRGGTEALSSARCCKTTSQTLTIDE